MNLRDRRSRLLVDRIDDLRAAWRYGATRMPFRTAAVCVLPDHLHCLWTLPPGDADFSTRWRLIKSAFSRAVPPNADPGDGRRLGERGVWQRRFWEHQIRDERDFEAHFNYIHFNPVKHGHASAMDDWPWSSWHRFRRSLGQDARDWTPPDLDAGE